MKTLYVRVSRLIQFSTDQSRFPMEDIPELDFESYDPELHDPAFDFGYNKDGELEFFRVLGFPDHVKRFAEQLKKNPIPDRYNVPQYNLENVSVFDVINYMLDNWKEMWKLIV